MSEDKSDQESVESGSCTCSDYNKDMSWFYDSRNLKRSTMRFSIISENTSDNKIFLFKKRRQYMFEKKLSKSNNNSNNNSNNSNNNSNNNINSSNNKSTNNLLNNSFTKRENYRKNIIKMTNSYSTKNIERKDERTNKVKKHKINLIEHPPRRKNDESIDELRNKPKPKKKSILTHKLRNNASTNNISPKINKDVKNHTKKSKFLPENDKDSEQNFNSPIEKKIDLNKRKNINNSKSNIDISRSPINLTKKRIHFYHLNRTAKNNNDEPFQKKNFNSPRSRGFISPKYKTYNNDNKNNDNIDENDEEQKYLNEYYNDIDKDNDKNKGVRDKYTNKNIITKHKIVKETRNIILQPGETIKPKSITKRKLRPHTTIVKNSNGKESIITENTYLTTVTVNEIVDSSNNRNGKISPDGQLVKQYITKIYKTETETVS